MILLSSAEKGSWESGLKPSILCDGLKPDLLNNRLTVAFTTSTAVLHSSQELHPVCIRLFERISSKVLPARSVIAR